MTIRRTQNPCGLQVGAPKGEGSKNRFFRYAAGLSLDVTGGDSGNYFVSTDEGVIHKCSLAYNEQFLDTYFGHKGPVNTVCLAALYLCLQMLVPHSLSISFSPRSQGLPSSVAATLVAMLATFM